MKVILLQDVAKIGRRHSVVEVPDGYALNQLIPKRLAAPATPHNLKQIERKQAEASAAKAAGATRFADAIAALTAHKLTISVDANDKNHLFQAVHEQEIVKAAKEAGVHIEVGMVQIATPIKETGEHLIALKHGTESGSFTIAVVKK